MVKPRSVDGDPAKEAMAAQLVAASKGRMKVPEALKVAGMPTPLRSNDSLRRRVHRESVKLQQKEIVFKDPGEEESTKKLPPGSVDAAKSTQSMSSLSGSRTTENADASDLEDVCKAIPFTSPDSGSTEPEKKRKHRRSSKQLQHDLAEPNRKKKKESQATKVATRMISENQNMTPSKRKTNKDIVDQVNRTYGTSVNAKSASRMVREGRIGVSPSKPGPVGNFPKHIWETMKTAFVTFLKLEQAESQEQSTMKDLSLRVNAMVNKGGFNKQGYSVTRRLKQHTAHEFNVDKKNNQEQRRVLWTTYSNLSLWFNTWEATLVSLGFARLATKDDNVEGSLFFFEGQTHRIINLDETDGNLDNCDGKKGGRPPVVFYADDIVGGATQRNKTSYKTTIICGSNAAGDPLPPHFQLKTTAKTSEGMRMNTNFIIRTKKALAQFGHATPIEFPCTFGMNDEGGMNAVELHKYLEKAIIPLFPDAEDKPGKRVIIKADSGPGRMNVEMLAHLRIRGFYLYPGVPNTTGVTQETDQNYGPFKSVYRDNLEKLSQHRFEKKKNLSVSDLPLLVFGYSHENLKEVDLRDAFSVAFSKEANLQVWKKVGAVPLTRKCLSNKQVRHEAVDGDPQEQILLAIEQRNDLACSYLTGQGFDGEQLRKLAPKGNNKQQQAVTVPHSMERIRATQKASTAGQHCHATGGAMINSDDFFEAKEWDNRDKLIAELEKKKKAFDKMASERKAAHQIMRDKPVVSHENEKSFTKEEVKVLLKFKLRKPPPNKSKKELIQLYLDTKAPSGLADWNESDRQRLDKLKSERISVRDTAIGVATKQSAKSAINNLHALDRKEQEELLAALQNASSSNQSSDNNSS